MSNLLRYTLMAIVLIVGFAFLFALVALVNGGFLWLAFLVVGLFMAVNTPAFTTLMAVGLAYGIIGMPLRFALRYKELTDRMKEIKKRGGR